MSALKSCLYHGEVVHRRSAPVRHELRYRVFNLFADIDELPELDERLRLFSYNRFNLFSIADRNHGAGDGSSLRAHVWAMVREVDPDCGITQVFMFCYPGVLGFVFNPLTVYYGYTAAGQLRLMIYEVNNTFGQRHSYVIPANDTWEQSCAKSFYVSPFNDADGRYHFRISPPGDTLKLAITLHTAGKPCLAAWFTGTREDLTDRNLFRSFASLPAMPLKVYGGIHWEAARLWIKGLRFKPRPAPPPTPVSISKSDGNTP